MLPLKNARFLKIGQLIDCIPNMQLLKLGNEREFKKLFELHAPRVLNTALYVLGNLQDAEDVTQEVFKSVYLGLPGFKEEASVNTWMYRITLNKCNEFLRTKNRKKRKGILLSLFDSPPIVTTETPELMLILKEAEWRLWQRIQALHDGRISKLKDVIHHYANSSNGVKPISKELKTKNNLLSPTEEKYLLKFRKTHTDRTFLLNTNFQYHSPN